MNVDRLIEGLINQRKLLTEREFKQLIQKNIQLFCQESNLQPVRSPVVICGDIHGQFYDLLELFKKGGDYTETNYIFLGDYVDRGNNSVETLQLLLLYKLKHPGRITLLRGNHQSRQVTMTYGFYSEIGKKYGNNSPWKHCMEMFDHMPVAAIVDNSIYCVHGGLSPSIRKVDQVRGLDRVQEVPIKGPLCDLMWSDPQEIKHWAQNNRGAGWLFGSIITQQFCRINNLKLICRAHQLANQGYQYWFSKKLVTIWSAPNYCKKCGNKASVLKLGNQLQQQFVQFQEAPQPEDNIPYKKLIPYFL